MHGLHPPTPAQRPRRASRDRPLPSRCARHMGQQCFGLFEGLGCILQQFVAH
jgi:hypothetical protein